MKVQIIYGGNEMNKKIYIIIGISVAIIGVLYLVIDRAGSNGETINPTSNTSQYDDYKKNSNLSSETASTEELVKFEGTLYGKSYAMIDYAGGSSSIGVVDKLIDSDYIPKLNGETNTKEILNALVFDKTDHSVVLQYNNEYVLFEKIVE